MKSDQVRVKITMLGAGSGFTQPLMVDTLNIPSIDGGEIALVDIDEERLDLAYQMVKKIVEMMGKEKSGRSPPGRIGEMPLLAVIT